MHRATGIDKGLKTGASTIPDDTIYPWDTDHDD